MSLGTSIEGTPQRPVTSMDVLIIGDDVFVDVTNRVIDQIIICRM
jgi:hypothetical protein